jgi:hypothetical protein
LCFTERKATGIVVVYVQFVTLSLTFLLDVDLKKCLFLSRIPPDILCAFLITPVHFSCPISPTVSQFTPHQHSLSSTKSAAPLYAISFIPLLLTQSSNQTPLSAMVLVQYFKCLFQWNTNTKTHHRTHLILYN